MKRNEEIPAPAVVNLAGFERSFTESLSAANAVIWQRRLHRFRSRHPLIQKLLGGKWMLGILAVCADTAYQEYIDEAMTTTTYGK